MIVATIIFGATLLLIPYIGGEFMPHLDEGALWVRATMPYTISFEEAAKFAPADAQDPDVLSAGDRGRLGTGAPRRRHRPTGFFNCEFYVGLKPYKDKTWQQGPIRNKAELTDGPAKESSTPIPA